MARLGFIIGLIALIGASLSGLAAYRVYEQELVIDRIALARAIDVHASLVQDRLTERELLARVASGLFRAPSLVKANMLEPLRSSIYAFKTDFVVASWVARLKPEELDAARKELARAGFPNPTIRDHDDKPLDARAFDKPIDVLMDLEPRNGQTVAFPGRSYDRHPTVGPLKDPRRADGELIANDLGIVTQRTVAPDAPAPSATRTVTFGNRDWSLGYYAQTNAARRAEQAAAIAVVIGLALTGIVCGLFGYVAYNNLRLSHEIEVRIGFERRLTAVIDELNHRVKNILAVIQSIVTRTLRHGSDIDTARELLIGRIHAMSNVVTLLSESQWQGVQLRGLFEARTMPNADRIVVNGPDIAISARAAQSLSLLLFELASHSDEGLSLVGKHPHVVANWAITGEEPETIFHFRWEEFNTSEATRRPDSDFGLILLDRVAPEALGGTSKRYFTDVSYVYELTAPMKTVVDMMERDRTEQLSAPVSMIRKSLPSP